MNVNLQQLLYLTFFSAAFCDLASAADWKMFAATPDHASFNGAETTITPGNATTLQAVWAQRFGTVFASAPTVVNGVLYFGGWNGYFYAVDGKDGRVLWQTFVGKAPDPDIPECQRGIGVTSQPVLSGDVVYVGGGDSAVYALNMYTGEQKWRVSLADPATGAYIWSSITLVKDALYVGVSSLGDCPLVRGALVRIDINAPDKPLIRYLIPEDQAGAGVWSTPAVDVNTDTVYVTTGTGEQDAELGIWGGTLMSLDATTLGPKHYYFMPTNSVEDDIEWGSSPTLYTGRDGRKRVAATGKDGVLYGLSADDLSLLFQTKIALGCICPECGCGSLSTPAFDGTALYLGAGVADPELFDSGSVYSINPDDGSIRWVRTTPGTVIAPVSVAGGLVFAGTTVGLNIFDAASGEPLWTDNDRGPMFSQPVIVDGTVYCTYVTGEVIAWRPSQQQIDPTQPPGPGAISRGSPPAPRNGQVW
jgi:polyvinyl alcohol dehydrogenase (cytochrome)